MKPYLGVGNRERGAGLESGLRDADGGALEGRSAGDAGQEIGREIWASDEDWRITSTTVEDERTQLRGRKWKGPRTHR